MTVILVIAAMTTAVKTVTVAAAVPVRVRSYFNLFRDVLDLIQDCFTECDSSSEESGECDSDESDEDDDDGKDLFGFI